MKTKTIAYVVAGVLVAAGAADLGLIAYQNRVAQEKSVAPIPVADGAAHWKMTFTDEGFFGRDFKGALLLDEGLELHFNGHLAFGLFPKVTMTLAPETRSALEISGEDETVVKLSPTGSVRTLEHSWKNLESGLFTLANGKLNINFSAHAATAELGAMRINLPDRPFEVKSMSYRYTDWTEGDPYAGKFDAIVTDAGAPGRLKGGLELSGVTTHSAAKAPAKTDAKSGVLSNSDKYYDVATKVRFKGADKAGKLELTWNMRLLNFRSEVLDALQAFSAGDLSALYPLQMAIAKEGATVELDELKLLTPQGDFSAAGRLAYKPSVEPGRSAQVGAFALVGDAGLVESLAGEATMDELLQKGALKKAQGPKGEDELTTQLIITEDQVLMNDVPML